MKMSGTFETPCPTSRVSRCEEDYDGSGANTLLPELEYPDIAMVCPETFPLPDGTSEKLRGVSADVHSGRGFAVLRGLRPEGHSDEDNVIAFCGIGSYIGRNRAANESGIAMDHLRDAIKDPKPKGKESVELHPSKMMAPLVSCRIQRTLVS